MEKEAAAKTRQALEEAQRQQAREKEAAAQREKEAAVRRQSHEQLAAAKSPATTKPTESQECCSACTVQ